MSITNQKLKGFYSISRFFSSSMIGLAMIVGVLSAGGLNEDLPLIYYLLVFIGGTLVSVHAMVYNDILDLEIDKINAPSRPLPSGILSIREAKFYHLLTAFLGTLCFYLADITLDVNFTWWYGLVHIILADVYSKRLKKTGIFGNFVVAWMSYAAFLYGDIIVNSGLTPVTQGLGIAGFLISLAREVIKGLMDVPGDKEFNIKTVAVLFGEQTASKLAVVFQIMVIVVFIFPIFVFSNLVGRVGSILVIAYMITLLYSNSLKFDGSSAKKAKTNLLLPPLIITPFVIIDTVV